jgi:predicted nucleotidyltransferase
MTFDPAPYIEHYKSENEREQRLIKARLAEAKVEADKLAERLHKLEGVRVVWFFGSAARGDATRVDFDLDLALEGGDVHRGLDVVEDSSFAVDLVSFDRLPASFQALIRQHGIRL